MENKRGRACVRNLLLTVLAASLLAAPVEAATENYTADIRPGTFVGARLRLPLGERAKARPRAELAIAPTQSRISNAGLVRTRIGEGIALDFASRKPSLTVAGVRADLALGMERGGQSDFERKMGISQAGWIAIGVGVVALAAGAYVLHLAYEADKNSD
jgi:hypothetical protein